MKNGTYILAVGDTLDTDFDVSRHQRLPSMLFVVGVKEYEIEKRYVHCRSWRHARY